jgi:hypothetical protein
VAVLQGLAVALVTAGPTYFNIQISLPDQRFYLVGVAGNLAPGLVIGIAGVAMRAGARWGRPLAGLGLAVAFGSHLGSVVLGGAITLEMVLLLALVASGLATAVSRFPKPVQPVPSAQPAAARETRDAPPAAAPKGSGRRPRSRRSQNGTAPAAPDRRASAPPRA